MQIKSARHPTTRVCTTTPDRDFQSRATLWIGLIVLLFAPTFSGCYQRTTAPSVTYDADEATQLRAELEKIEWE